MISETFRHRPPRIWTRIIIETAPKMSEQVAALLAEFTGAGIEFANAVDTAGEKIIGYLESDDGTNADLAGRLAGLHGVLADLTREFPGLPQPELKTETVQEEDWSSNWKKHFKPFHISQHLVIRPSWEEYSAVQGEAVIELDPGLAFGTGHHASTRLALKLLDDLFLAPGAKVERVLDLGCGTGILGMACGLFGSRSVIALDNDPDAVAVARENIDRNNLGAKVEVSGRDIADINGPFDLVVANITHDVLADLAPRIVGLLAPAGRLVLAGILKDDQEESIKNIYEKAGCSVIAQAGQDEWTAMSFIKQ